MERFNNRNKKTCSSNNDDGNNYDDYNIYDDDRYQYTVYKGYISYEKV